MMEKPELKNWLTLGNLITILVMAGGFGVTWGTFSSTSASHAKILEDHEYRLRMSEDEIRRTLTRMDARLSAIEKAVQK